MSKHHDFFSASSLCKNSAAKIRYLSDKPRPAISDHMIAGDKFAQSHSTSPMVELAGKYYFKDILIAFSIDEVQEYRNILRLIEHKSVRQEELWYFRNCLIQTAFYGCLVELCVTLKTARYQSGEQFEICPLNYDKIRSILNYGGIKYRVTYDLVPIMRFFLTKARASRNSWEVAKKFDAMYNKKEWDYFRPFITYRKV